jgi:hypothetical protein
MRPIGCLVTQDNQRLYDAFMGLGLQMKVSSVSVRLCHARVDQIGSDRRMLRTRCGPHY